MGEYFHIRDNNIVIIPLFIHNKLYIDYFHKTIVLFMSYSEITTYLMDDYKLLITRLIEIFKYIDKTDEIAKTFKRIPQSGDRTKSETFS